MTAAVHEFLDAGFLLVGLGGSLVMVAYLDRPSMTSRTYVLLAFLMLVLLCLLSGCAIEPRTPGAYEKRATWTDEHERIAAMIAEAEECARHYSEFEPRNNQHVGC